MVQSTARRRAPRVLLYSHDTFGLGHLRRSRTIAQALARAWPSLSALIVTGSPVAGRFAFPERVDHVRLPGVIKLPDGSYASQTLGLDIDDTTDLRAGLIAAAVEGFGPDLVIIDKEPTGFRGELLTTLEGLRDQGHAKVVLGIRDVLDAPEPLAAEWARKGATAAANRYYDALWIYGLPAVYDPLQAIDLAPSTRDAIRWTGYLRREIHEDESDGSFRQPYVLVTPGGGGDGDALVDWVLRAYEADPALSPGALIVYGPFLSGPRRAEFEARVEALRPRVRTSGFETRMETLMQGAAGVIAMGGYNTFCEILSFDCPAVIAPRTFPRLEQHIRAAAAERLGLTRMLDPVRDGSGAAAMAAAIRGLADQPRPSASAMPGLLDGTGRIVAEAAALLGLEAP